MRLRGGRRFPRSDARRTSIRVRRTSMRPRSRRGTPRTDERSRKDAERLSRRFLTARPLQKPSLAERDGTSVQRELRLAANFSHGGYMTAVIERIIPRATFTFTVVALAVLAGTANAQSKGAS